MTVAHIPARPAWRCTGCAEPWPCAAKREQLVTEYAESPAALRTMMALRVADAAEDLRQLGAEQLWSRFLGWLPAPGQGPVIRWVANPPLGGHRHRPPPRAQIDPRGSGTVAQAAAAQVATLAGKPPEKRPETEKPATGKVSTLPEPAADSDPTRIPPPRQSRRGTR